MRRLSFRKIFFAGGVGPASMSIADATPYKSANKKSCRDTPQTLDTAVSPPVTALDARVSPARGSV